MKKPKYAALIFSAFFSTLVFADLQELSDNSLNSVFIENTNQQVFNNSLNTNDFSHKPFWQDQTLKQSSLTPVNFASLEAQAAELRYQSNRLDSIASLNQQIANNPAVAFIALPMIQHLQNNTTLDSAGKNLPSLWLNLGNSLKNR